MKVGLLVECGREGLEAIVCRKLCQLIAAEKGIELELEIVPMDNKARLLEECGKATSNLLANGCKRVVILWDERPAWPEMGAPLCWHNDRLQALAELQAANVPENAAHLVCIEREFESWLLFDHKMLECVLSRPAHPVRVPKQSKPHRQPNPKGKMTTLFRELAHKTYVDVLFAKQFASCFSALNRIRRCKTFKRFELALTGQL